MPVDGVEGGGHLSLNMASMGMDAEVARKMVRYKNLPLVSGPMAYNLAIADVFFHKIGMELDITIDTPEGEIRRAGPLFLCAGGLRPVLRRRLPRRASGAHRRRPARFRAH